MFRAPYVQGRPYDDLLPRIVAGIGARIADGKDDAVILGFGPTGGGKTTLSFHVYEIYAKAVKVAPSLERVALTRKDFAQALHKLAGAPIDRFVDNDEGNMSKREALTQWNRDTIDLYFAIRGKGGLHWWNNPSLDYIDRPFIEERLKFAVFCFSKSRSVRKYWLFSKDGMLRMLDKEGDLKTYTVRKRGERYAEYEGWFRAYDGPLWAGYLAKKEERMDEKLGAFQRKYGLEDALSMVSAAARLGCSDKTLKKAVQWAVDQGTLKRDVDYALKGSRWLLTASGVEVMRDFVANSAHSTRRRGGVSENPGEGAPLYYSRERKAGPAAGW